MEKNCCFSFCFIAMPLTNTYHPEIATKFSCCIVCSKSDKVDVLSLTISFIRVNGPTNCLTNFLQNITNSQSLASNLTVDSKSNLLDLFNFRKLKFVTLIMLKAGHNSSKYRPCKMVRDWHFFLPLLVLELKFNYDIYILYS